MKPAAQITDRAKRYRAVRNAPRGPRVCNFCGVRKNIDVDHISGDETEGDDENLMYLCRRCNTQKGVIQARARIGQRTRQYNPAARVPSFAQYSHAVNVLLGLEPGNAQEATAAIRRTPPDKRIEYARRRQRSNPAPSFEAYLAAVKEHTPKAHDKGGKIIHATPLRLRREYAARIADFKRQRRGDVPF